MVEELVAHYGLPRSLHSEPVQEFECQLIAEQCKLLWVKKTRTVSYNPMSDGLVEQSNRTLKQMLTMLVDETLTNWEDHVPYVLWPIGHLYMILQNVPQIYSCWIETNLPIDLMCRSSPETPQCPMWNGWGVQWIIPLSLLEGICMPVQRDTKLFMTRIVAPLTLPEGSRCGAITHQKPGKSLATSGKALIWSYRELVISVIAPRRKQLPHLW